jgi:hypothetical protein
MAAMRSLPLPLGPVMSTGTSERATWQASYSGRSVASASKMRSPSL